MKLELSEVCEEIPRWLLACAVDWNNSLVSLMGSMCLKVVHRHHVEGASSQMKN